MIEKDHPTTYNNIVTVKKFDFKMLHFSPEPRKPNHVIKYEEKIKGFSKATKIKL